MMPKFRAWDKELEMLFPVHFIRFDDELDLFSVGHRYCHGKELSRAAADLELMQWTGLQDKNGKDIYEGDILRMRLLGKNEYIEGVVGITPTQGVIVSFSPIGVDYQIIGNIYENAGLLDINI